MWWGSQFYYALLGLVAAAALQLDSAHASGAADVPVHGNETFAFRELVVQSQSPPKITLAPRDKKVLEEGTVSFFCRASGNPAPSFHWERLGKRVNARRNRFEVIEAPHISVLRIKPVKANKDNSTFTCVANNGLGEARADAQLKVIRKVDGRDGEFFVV
ncbi:tyrosine-protein phosphatase Lar [Aplysia californica]|uniref:Tyrosine-protein phosphatase Lar n=1 Tax=Aplysia californica TaxID=6500 RepID=A0ABM0JST2_APLCA|nr:tyrosine-protein phosphatase Lar [Aplysia californica]XP_005100671.1 tyrosine-protein phosphatase Lar [Aplysia californica]XP_005100672.1 tyrosine-protein phosphatase Lar [Aplysia californica]XP_005100673.1 tyrosine-protein phosphatase Lar [Aplysia californica]XP_005100674.1 tyrosine-protein phosphatase Lar [Aplysia californica]XP_005100675.1 tyrosine-protein phosphatase Lar [Aplysia californica]XP_005100676.1 tyrosine-protein phosphatase Lar [Aplysia californica]XP_005100677.1 tyrosine-p